MANHKSALKRARQNTKRRIQNRTVRNRTRTMVKLARVSIKTGESKDAVEATRQAIRVLDKAASAGVIHKNNAARRKSRLMQKLAVLTAAK